MDDVDLKAEARRTRGCRFCGWFLFVLIMGFGLLLFADYMNTQRLLRNMASIELDSTAEVEAYIAEHDIRIKRKDGEWKADPPWKQQLVDRLRERFDQLADRERVAEAKKLANDSAQYLRRLLEQTPEDLRPRLAELQERMGTLTERETLRQAIKELGQLDAEWLEQEAQRQLESEPGENRDLYIQKLRALLDNVSDERLRQRLRETIEKQVGLRDRGVTLGPLPDINPETGEVQVVLDYLEETGDTRRPFTWDFVREIELEDGPAYSVKVIFYDGSRNSYYIRNGAVFRTASYDEDGNKHYDDVARQDKEEAGS